ncbi:DUF3320 domain-containing protein [Rhizobium leguminosarum]|uniref:DUF3320 domain-containing protein n=1 Tax=Rhizobium leguminosarum TaxID=384 RepID=A0A7M3DI85_RHILE|nr:DUF3320 domain-containing protein [Rhizobium leguminosarum]TAY41484.1 DUF3320 domain-containing protein [Rhizobium leguminosarum]
MQSIDLLDQAENILESEERIPTVTISPDVVGSINYASWQNSVPVLRSVKITNDTAETLGNLRLEFDVTPAFSKRKIWTIDRIAPGDSLTISDRVVELDPDYLAGLNEAERGRASFRLSSGDHLVAETFEDVRLLARDEWGGFGSMAALLAAFVMPNDPAVAKIIKEAANVLGNHGHSPALEGYQSQDPRRSYMLGAAIWSAISARRLTYAEPPRSFEKNGQKVRRPATIVEDGLATCLDTSLLFAAALEAVGLNPVIVLLDGHAYAGFWLVKKTFPNLIETDAGEVRKALSGKELVTFETTAVTHNPPSTFDDAMRIARTSTSEQEEDRFVAAIDITRARMSQIRPMASHQRPPESGAEASADGVALPLPPLPDFNVIPADIAEEKPTTAAGRIDRWQRKLLDLSLRNRLLNFKDSKQAVPFLCPDVPFLEDRLAEQARIRIISLPEQNPLGDRDEKLHFQATGKDINVEFALGALQRDEVSSPLPPKDLDGRLTEIYRRAQNDMAEGGSNTLFLAVGFLRWKKSPEDVKAYRAPLLLVPVKLERRSASSRFHILHHEDEVRFNSTLLQLLKKDFDLQLPQLEGTLPVDESGIDVPMVLEMVRRAVRDVAGFEVINETALSTFSFAKFLMWKDLVERTDSLRQNRVVRHLIDSPEQAFEAGVSTAFPSERDVDLKYEPRQLVTPLAADSSQLAATMAAAEGQDFVLIGPPGTGKSQTIANMIAQCLSAKKSVLFVAEKTAALDVVYRRLREHGLGDYCLEIHSNKAERKQFVTQLKASWEAGTSHTGEEWIRVNDRLKIRRDELNAYVEALHRQSPNGLTIFTAMGVFVRGKDSYAPELSWGDTIRHDRASYQHLVALIEELALTFRAIKPVPSLRYINIADWSASWESRFLAQSDKLAKVASTLQPSLQSFTSLLGIESKADCSLSELNELAGMAAALRSASSGNYGIVFERQFEQLKSSIAGIEDAITQFKAAEGKLSAAYAEDDLGRIPIDDLDREWREANAAIWPKSSLGKRRVRKLLQSYATSGQVDPDNDLPQLRVMKTFAGTVQTSELGRHAPGWKGTQTDTTSLRLHFDQAAAMRSALVRLGQMAGSVKNIAQSVAPYLSHGSSDHPLRDSADRFLQARQAFITEIKAYRELAGSVPADAASTSLLAGISQAMQEIRENQSALQAWTSWCGVRKNAEAHGISPFVAALEEAHLRPDQLADAFELSYARWWLPPAIDADNVLRQFKRFQHEEALLDFRKLDDLARASAASEVRRKLVRDLPKPNEVPRRSELGLLRHQMELQRPSKSIREMIAGMPENFAKLAPCLLMSPLSIAQYLPADQALFDVVVFDEASQITTWDAIGALARGKQAIIVGDPKQLPPTNFFGRADGGEDDPDIQEYEKDLESILDEAKASGLPVLQLNWHYRSQHESLIAFSNWHYYGNRLVTFPSPVTEDRAVSLRYLPNAIYDRGKSRTNKSEAEAIANDATARMLAWLKLPESVRPTLGVITFNSQQQSLIEDLLDQKRRDHPEIEWFFAKERIEPTVIKNLENVQGDERDVMLFSITFGHDHAGKLTMTFGALNGDGGERRLNVAVTRARQELMVYSSITSDKIDTGRTKAIGVHHLKTFLDFAERGAIALPAVQKGSVGSFDSPFEEAVAAALDGRGWTTVPQIGVSGFRVDLGIVHPDKPGAFLAGIECDGATYHRSATARDRDKIREQILRGLGWNIVRIWSPDWWYDKNGATDRLHEALQQLVLAGREQEAEKNVVDAAQTAQADSGMTASPEFNLEDLLSADDSAEVQQTAVDVPIVAADRDEIPFVQEINTPISMPVSANEAEAHAKFRRADLSTFKAEPDTFFDFSYRSVVDEMLAAVVTAEAPVRDDVLAQRIARAHGWLRTGNRIREKIERHLSVFDVTDDSAGRFIWLKGSVTTVVDYRAAETESDRRPVTDISLPELIGFVRQYPLALEEPDPALVFARLLGLERLAASSRARLDEAIAAAKGFLKDEG